MAGSEKKSADPDLTPARERLSELWEEHVRYEFSTRNTEDTLATMVEDAYVNHIPVLTGGSGAMNCAISTRNVSFRRSRRIRK
jgi:carboxymethylenebutenolidase